MIAALASIAGAASVFVAFAYMIRERALRPDETRIRGLDARQGLVVSRPQFGRVGHIVEVADGAPGYSKPLGSNIQSFGNGAPLCGEVGGAESAEPAV